MTEASEGAMGKAEADNLRMAAAQRRKEVANAVHAERSRLAWLSKFEVVRRNHRIASHNFELAFDDNARKMERLDQQARRRS
jgi:hypothetical protein